MNGRISWWQWLPLPGRKWRIVLCVETGDLIPDRLPGRGVVVVCPAEPTWVAFDCPCGKGHRVMLNLNTARYPRWTIKQHKPLTLSPSIDDEAAGRRCHFFLTGGRVTWVQDDVRSDIDHDST